MSGSKTHCTERPYIEEYMLYESIYVTRSGKGKNNLGWKKPEQWFLWGARCRKERRWGIYSEEYEGISWRVRIMLSMLFGLHSVSFTKLHT